MTWAQARTLRDAGHEVGSHGLSHQDVTRLPARAVEEEVRQSKVLVEHELETTVEAFAYPYGTHNALARRFVEASYDVSFSTVKSPHTDWAASTHTLRRDYIPTGASDEAILRFARQDLVVWGD